MARKVDQTRMVIVGAPGYLARRGSPSTPDELRRHNLLGANYVRPSPAGPCRTKVRMPCFP
jgi:hypothetical protein